QAPAPRRGGGGGSGSSLQFSGSGGGRLARGPAACSAELAPHLHGAGKRIPAEHDQEHREGGDDVTEIAHRAGSLPAAGCGRSLPVARRATQALPASRRRLSARARSSSEPTNQNLVPITIHHNGQAMLGSMDDSPKTRIVCPWCSEFHHTTE